MEKVSGGISSRDINHIKSFGVSLLFQFRFGNNIMYLHRPKNSRLHSLNMAFIYQIFPAN